MPADFTIVQGDTEPFLLDNLKYSDGTAVNLAGATVTLTMRDLTAAAPVKLTGTVGVTEPTEGGVLYSPTAADTASPGMYMGSWRVVFSDGGEMTFPTVGYLWIQVQPNLTSGAGMIVGLPEVLEYLNIDPADRAHDTKLMEHIRAVAPLIEAEIGPVIPTVYDEWFNGGHATIALPHKPSTGYGARPILRLLAASEYRGPIEYDLAIIGTPAQGQIYSVMLDPVHGIVTRRTAGGGTMVFPFDAQRGNQQVHLVYEAGQEEIPENVKMAAKEAIRVNYRSTQDTGKGKRAQADALETGAAALGFFLPGRCLELLTPNRAFPSIA
jgi:hypothetical protein